MEKSKGFYQKGYQRDMFALSDKYRIIFEIIGGLKPKVFLDIGCGDGSFAEKISHELGVTAYGQEISRAGCQSAEKAGIKCFNLDIDQAKVPLADKSVDVIFCGEIIEHVYSPDRLLLEVHRLLRPKGCLVITTPNLASWFNRWALLFGYQPAFTDISWEKNFGQLLPMPPLGHLRLFTPRALQGLLQFYGFEIIDRRGLGINTRCGYGKKHFHMARFANWLFSSYRCNSDILFVGRKSRDKIQSN